ncbi:MAG: hypothetical protein GY804_02000 [Alphaproteobacteria bacterium]|nr:hypothetical protein [Alphaproteobacteria bacterium]
MHKFKFFISIMLFLTVFPVDLSMAKDLTTQNSITKVAYNHTKLLRLSQEAATVILNKENIVSIKMETPKLFMLRALSMGETGLKVLDSNYNEIFSTTIVVAPEEGRHVNISRSTDNAGFMETTLSCGSERCVEVVIKPEENME